MLQVKGRKLHKVLEPVVGQTILDHALRADVDWGFSCTRGTCARCRTFIEEGMELLAVPTEAEELRLEPEELEAGYRLGCQAVVRAAGPITAVHRPYF